MQIRTLGGVARVTLPTFKFLDPLNPHIPRTDEAIEYRLQILCAYGALRALPKISKFCH